KKPMYWTVSADLRLNPVWYSHATGRQASPETAPRPAVGRDTGRLQTHCKRPRHRTATGECLTNPRVYQVMEALLDLITSLCLWQDQLREAPSGTHIEPRTLVRTVNRPAIVDLIQIKSESVFQRGVSPSRRQQHGDATQAPRDAYNLKPAVRGVCVPLPARRIGAGKTRPEGGDLCIQSGDTVLSYVGVRGDSALKSNYTTITGSLITPRATGLIQPATPQDALISSNQRTANWDRYKTPDPLYYEVSKKPTTPPSGSISSGTARGRVNLQSATSNPLPSASG
ncbi:hypothetical protein KUCAC02_023614, partial [Chaenocephalus aceratus]